MIVITIYEIYAVCLRDEEIFTGGQVFFAEMLGTSLLLFNVLSTIDIPAEGGGALGVFPIAMSVTVAHCFLLPIDGCSINPTRSFGPSLVAAFAGIEGQYYHQQYMFWFAPLFGAALAAIAYGTSTAQLYCTNDMNSHIYIYLFCICTVYSAAEYGSLKADNATEGNDMANSIFMALKRPAVKVNTFIRRASVKGGIGGSDLQRMPAPVDMPGDEDPDAIISPLQAVGFSPGKDYAAVV
jgi:hypothetical protein